MIVAATLVSVCALVFYYGICISAFEAGEGFGMLRRINKISLIFSAVLLAGSAVFSWFVITRNHTVYYWDQAAYWRMCLQQAEFVFREPLELPFELMRSINEDDYNLLLPTVLALPTKLLGGSFTAYAFCNMVLFGIPVQAVLGLCGCKLAEKWSIDPSLALPVSTAAAVFMPYLYCAVFMGYVDVGALLPGVLLLWILLDIDLTELQLDRSMALALTMLLCWLSRRYWAYFIVACAVVLTVLLVTQCLRERTPKAVGAALANYLLIGCVSGGTLLLLFRPFVLRALTNNYGEQYQGWDMPLGTKLGLLLAGAGLLTVLLLVVSLGYGLFCPGNRDSVLMLLGMLVLQTAMFFRVQAMGWHHMYLILPQIVLLIDLSLLGGLMLHKSLGAVLRLLLSVVCCAAYLFHFAYFFQQPLGLAERMQTVPGAALFSRLQYEPLQRDDMEQLEALINTLNGLTEGTEDRIYVIASGEVLNYDILRSFALPKSDNAVPALEQTADADLRDGFPTAFLTARYVVVTNPVQLHLAEGTQEVVRLLAQGVQDPASVVGRHYAAYAEFPLEQGVNAILYVRVTDWQEDELEALRYYFTARYPGQEALFAQRIALPAA